MGVSGIDKDLKTALQNESQVHSKLAESTERVDRLRPKTVGGIGSQDLLNIPGSATPSMAGSHNSLAAM